MGEALLWGPTTRPSVGDWLCRPLIYFSHCDALCRAVALQDARLHYCGGSVPLIGHWREYSDVQHRPRGAPSFFTLSRLGPSGVRLVHSSESSRAKTPLQCR